MTKSNVTMSEIEPLLVTLRPWLSRPNIVGLHVGTKTVAGKDTGQPAIVVHVERKLAPDALGPGDFLVPAEVQLDQMTSDGQVRTVPVPTDVIETGANRPGEG